MIQYWEGWWALNPTPMRLILFWDNVAGQRSWTIVRWLCQEGVMPLYTPLSGVFLFAFAIPSSDLGSG